MQSKLVMSLVAQCIGRLQRWDSSRFLVFIVITRQELTRACLEKGTELIQPIAHSLFALPSSDDPDGPIVLLPQPTTKLPREKQVRTALSSEPGEDAFSKRKAEKKK
ncbi:hypothetical protein BHM03_00038429 [Ensete ventricosum]|nr:hypothetical protein BHM03_00038429 [Ensete ventricosum]